MAEFFSALANLWWNLEPGDEVVIEGAWETRIIQEEGGYLFESPYATITARHFEISSYRGDYVICIANYPVYDSASMTIHDPRKIMIMNKGEIKKVRWLEPETVVVD